MAAGLEDNEVLNDEGLEFEEEEGQGEAEGQAEPAKAKESEGSKDAPWRAELDAMRREQADSNLRVVAALSELMRKAETKLQPQKQDSKPEGPSDEDKAEAFKFALGNAPDILPKLLRQEAEQVVGAQMATVEQRLAKLLDERDASKLLTERLRTDWASEIRDPNSEIIRGTPEATKLLAAVLDPRFIGTDLHQTLAFFLSAGQNPRAVAKRETVRMRAEAQRKAETRQRASAAGGGSGARVATELTVTEDDEVRARRFGVDLSDKKTRERFLSYKQGETLSALGMGQTVEGS